MSLLERWRGFFLAVKRWMPLLLEIAVTLASFRMALILLSNQGYFERFPNFFGWLVRNTIPYEWAWGALAMGAALCKAVGMIFLVGRRNPRFEDAAFLLREAGWGAGCVFWAFMFTTITLGDPESLGSCLTLSMFLLSAGGMAMGPSMPEDPLDARR
jgi:hypothetical protein